MSERIAMGFHTCVDYELVWDTTVVEEQIKAFDIRADELRMDIEVDSERAIWIVCLALAAVAGAASGLYDKYVVRRLDPVFVQSWYNLYQAAMMAVAVALLRRPGRRDAAPFRWSWAIPLISIFLSLADFAYLMALRDGEAMISVVSMIRRGSVVVSFCCGALLFRERNLRAKALDLLFILIGMVFLYLGSKP